MMRRLLNLTLSFSAFLGVAIAQAPTQYPFAAAAPPPVTVGQATIVGAPGFSAYYYWVVANYPPGAALPAASFPAVNAAATLTGSNYVALSWRSTGAVTYDVLRTSSNVFPAGTSCSCAVSAGLTSTTVNDQGAALSAYTIPATASTATATIFLDNLNYASGQLRARIGGLESGLATTGVQVVNSSITAVSLGTQAICALHTDPGCFNSVTDATTVSCPAGTLTATCTFPVSITIPANTLGANIATLEFVLGQLATTAIPNSTVEVYLDSTRVFAGTASSTVAGARSGVNVCVIGAPTAGAAAPLFFGCSGNGGLPSSQSFASNTLNTNAAPAVAIDTTVSHVLKVSLAYASATGLNMAWLYGIRFTP